MEEKRILVQNLVQDSREKKEDLEDLMTRDVEALLKNVSEELDHHILQSTQFIPEDLVIEIGVLTREYVEKVREILLKYK